MPIQAAAVRRVWRTVGFGLIALVIWLSLTPQPIEIPVENGDKLGHVIVWDADTGEQVVAVDAPVMYTWDKVQRLHSIGGVRSLAFSPIRR